MIPGRSEYQVFPNRNSTCSMRIERSQQPRMGRKERKYDGLKLVHWSLVDLGTVERNARFDVMHDMREVGNSIHIQSWIYASFGDYRFLVHMSTLVDWTDVNGLNRIHRYLWCIWCIWCIIGIGFHIQAELWKFKPLLPT